MHAQHPALAPYPYAGAPYPPLHAGAYPPFVYAAPVPDGHHDPNANGAPQPPFLMAYPPPPPGMVYAIPAPMPPANGQAPGGVYPQFAPSASISQVMPRPKRKQVKMACTNCATACKRCDEARPCERCLKYGLASTCVDGVRKERKKGIKRGPYKRKNKSLNGDTIVSAPPPQGLPVSPPNGEAHDGHAQSLPYMLAPEGYYQYFYPGFAPPVPAHAPADGSQPPQQNGSTNGTPSAVASPTPQAPPAQPPASNHPSLSHPGVPPYFHQVYPPPFNYPTPGVGYPQPYPIMVPPPAQDPKNDQNGDSGKGKKRAHPSGSATPATNGEGDPKAKRARTGQDDTNGVGH
ncbi:unnamed protein product [Somion occarium]